MTNLDSILKSRDITLPTKVHLVKAMVFPVVMYGCENWTIKKAEHWRTDTFELWSWRRLLRVLDYREIQPFNPKGNQFFQWIFRTDTEAPILWPPDVKNWLIGKNPDSGKDWRQEEKGISGMRWLDDITNSMEFEQAPGVGDGQGGLVCCSPWGHKESVMTEWLNWTELNWSKCSFQFICFFMVWSQVNDFTPLASDHSPGSWDGQSPASWVTDMQKRSFFLWDGDGVPCPEGGIGLNK